MIYRVIIKHSWRELHFDFDKNNTSPANRVDEIALQFMTLAKKTFVGSQDEPIDERDITVSLEVLNEEEEEEEF